jgi:hypothetical protein
VTRAFFLSFPDAATLALDFSFSYGSAFGYCIGDGRAQIEVTTHTFTTDTDERENGLRETNINRISQFTVPGEPVGFKVGQIDG